MILRRSKEVAWMVWLCKDTGEALNALRGYEIIDLFGVNVLNQLRQKGEVALDVSVRD